VSNAGNCALDRLATGVFNATRL